MEGLSCPARGVSAFDTVEKSSVARSSMWTSGLSYLGTHGCGRLLGVSAWGEALFDVILSTSGVKVQGFPEAADQERIGPLPHCSILAGGHPASFS